MSNIINPASVRNPSATELQDEAWSLSDQLEAKTSELESKVSEIRSLSATLEQKQDAITKLRDANRDSNGLLLNAKAAHAKELAEVKKALDQANEGNWKLKLRVQSLEKYRASVTLADLKLT